MTLSNQIKQRVYFMSSNEGKARIPMTRQMLLMMNAGNSGAGTQQTRHRGERVFQEHYCSV